MKLDSTPAIATYLTGLSLTLLVGCNATIPPSTSTAPDNSATTTNVAKPAVASQSLVSFSSETSTTQGGSVDAFTYSEKPGDSTLGNVKLSNGVVRVTGKLGGEKGSSWGGIGLIAGTAAGEKTVALPSKGSLRIKLASASATTLRVRIMGQDKGTRDNGCYPVAIQKVTAELRDYTIPLAAFAPESYCAAQGRQISAVVGAVGAIEVSDPTVQPKARNVDFSVGDVEVQP